MGEILANGLDNISDKTEALLLSYISKKFYEIKFDGPESIEKTINIWSIIDKFNQDKINGDNTYIYVDAFNLYNELGDLFKENVASSLMKITEIRNDSIVVNFEGSDYVIKFSDVSLVTIVSS